MKSFGKGFCLLVLVFIQIGGLLSQEDELNSPKIVVQEMFRYMFEAQSDSVRMLFKEEATLSSVALSKSGKSIFSVENPSKFFEIIGQHEQGELDERISYYSVQQHGQLASVWTDYRFYYKGEYSHCGVNQFDLVQETDGTWKIASIIDTRSKENCVQPVDSVETHCDTFVEAWHRAAAVADEDVFFGAMISEGIYIGTDQTELWTRDEMRAWAKRFFVDREVAWDFKTMSRNVYLSDDRMTAWWDEKLDTWMGVCRGSGVLVKVGEGWKIAHYHLSVTIDNAKIKDFIKLTKP